MALHKNDTIELTITAATSEGSGLGRYVDADSPQGCIVFVPFTAPGDTVLCRILRVEKSHAFGRIERILTPSPDRLDAGAAQIDCKAFGLCGGCAWRHVTYEAELRYKRQIVADAVLRIGGCTLTPEPTVPSPAVDRYRNKAQYPVAPGEHAAQIGFYALRSHRIIPQQDCRLQPEEFSVAVREIARWMKKYAVQPYDERAKTGLLRHIYIRKGEETGEILVCLVCTSGKLPAVDALIAQLRNAVPGLVGICVNKNARDTNVILGESTFALWGRPYLLDRLCGLTFRLSPHSFYQVNRRQVEQLYMLAQREAGLTGGETLLDLYCGTGTIGLTMAHRVRELIGVEIVPQAVEDARLNAEQNGIENARFFCSDAAAAAEKLRQEGIAPQVIIVDPPRKGCGAELCRTIGEMAPDRLVYVSCDPATLARDIRFLRDEGYAPERITPVDMFPRTTHVETVCLLSKLNTKQHIEINLDMDELDLTDAENL